MSSITHVSFLTQIKIQIESLIIGVWILIKRIAKWAWSPNAFFAQTIRDNPPRCLVDSSFGQHNYVKLKDVKLHYVETGCSTQPLILLLHGFPDCWLSWRHQLPILSKHFRCIALDLKGFGDSDKPIWRSSYRLQAIIDELRQLILTFGVKRCTIIGHDLGGLIGWFLCYQYPELVDKFVAITAPHPNHYWTSNLINKQLINIIQWPYLPEIDALKEDIKLISEFHSDEAFIDAYKYAFSRKDDWTGPMNYLRNFLYQRIVVAKTTTNGGGDLLKVHTLLVCGSLGLESVVASCDYCDRYLVKVVDGCGRAPHQENPVMFNKVLLKFLKVHDALDGDKKALKSPSKGLMDRMFGAVTTTVKYGNCVLDSVVQKKHIVSIPTLNLTSKVEQ